MQTKGRVPTDIICILGMHRSGTSLTARVLSLLGASIGPADQRIPAAADNPKGYWELQAVVELNKELLARFGGRTMAPPTLVDGWESSRHIDDLRERARTIFRGAFSDAELAVWKDPRTCLTLPFWQLVLPPMRYVICVRHPLEVASSLSRRDRIGHERAMYLWLLHLNCAVRYTREFSHCISMFDRLLEDTVSEVERLAAFAGLGERSRDAEVMESVLAFVDRHLRHHRIHKPGDAGVVDRVSGGKSVEYAEAVYSALLGGARLDAPELTTLLRLGLNAVRPSARVPSLHPSD